MTLKTSKYVVKKSRINENVEGKRNIKIMFNLEIRGWTERQN